MRPMTRLTWFSTALFLVAVLVLDWYRPSDGLRGSSIWDVRGGDFDRHSDATVSSLAHVALLWSPKGALVAATLAVIITALAALRMVSPWAVPLALATGLAWQVSGYLALAFQVDWLRTPRPGLGIVGVLVATGLSLLAVLRSGPEPDRGGVKGGNR